MRRHFFKSMIFLVFGLGIMACASAPADKTVILSESAGVSTSLRTGPKHKAIIIHHNDWTNAALTAQTELESRGYTVILTDNATTGLNALTQASTSLARGDYLFVYLAGHGSNPRNFGDTAKDRALHHFVEFNYGTLRVNQVAPLFEQIAQNEVHLTVIDGSCNGGETVLYAMGQSYCAVATTGVLSPSLTDFPAPSNAMHRDTKPGRFGLWWKYPHMTASWMTGEIITQHPERINQRIFRNDNTEMANLSLFLRPSIGFLTSLDLGGWNLHYQYCYLYRFIYPDEYTAMDQTEKDKFTNSLPTYLAAIHSTVDPAAPFYTQLDGYLNSDDLLSQASTIYTAGYTEIWRTLANDPTWNIVTNPGKHTSEMKDLSPDRYTGEDGFLKIANEIEFLMLILQIGFQQQEALLVEIDALAKNMPEEVTLPEVSETAGSRIIWPPDPGYATIKFNKHERAVMKKASNIERQLKIDRKMILKPSYQKLESKSLRLSKQEKELEAEKSINYGIENFKVGYKTIIDGKIGLSQAAIDSLNRHKLEDLIGKFKAVSPILYYAEARLSFLLSVFEDAISKAQAGSTNPIDQIPF